MADNLADKLAGAAIDTASTTLSFANRNLKLNTEEDGGYLPFILFCGFLSKN